MISKGILFRTRVYLAGNIESCRDSSWRERITKRLNKLGIISLDPTKQVFTNQVLENQERKKKLLKWRKYECYFLVHDFMKAVIQKDLRQIDICDFVIVNLDYTKFTAGTLHEIIEGNRQRKPLLFLVKNKNKMPLWIIGLCNMNFVFEGEDKLISYLEEVNLGKKVLDNKYWK